MKLRNRKTGEISNLESKGLLKSDNNNHIIVYPDGTLKYYAYNSLAELNEEWEDYEEEEKEYYTLNSSGQIWTTECFNKESIKNMKSIGNYFDTREEAELAVRKLKAWKRLKDKGFRFQGWEDLEAIELPIKHYNNIIGFRLEDNHDVIVDLNTIFGGEE